MAPSTVLSKDNCNDIPNEETLEAACKTKILAEDGSEVSFGSIFADRKTIVIFVRELFL
jgi:hypothetical protein